MVTKKNTLFIFLLFLFFFPAYAIFNNAIIFLFDQLFVGGEISKLFNYNYTGNLIGCLEHAKLYELQERTNFSITNAILSTAFCISLIFWLMVVMKKNFKSNTCKWISIFMFSFFLYTSLDFFIVVVLNINVLDFDYFKANYLITILSTLTMLLAGYLFLKSLDKTEKKQLFIFVITASLLSAIVWFGRIGPLVLPI
ncbi:MAG: hypothetical protein GYB39_02155 [Algicola sp.]|nr:hypothetical protein [Algicola sp.]